MQKEPNQEGSLCIPDVAMDSQTHVVMEDDPGGVVQIQQAFEATRKQRAIIAEGRKRRAIEDYERRVLRKAESGEGVVPGQGGDTEEERADAENANPNVPPATPAPPSNARVVIKLPDVGI